MAEDHWQPARLIPTSGISGQEEAERRASSALLAVMGSVREFGLAMVKPLGAPAGPIATYIEVPFKTSDDRTCRPDGVVQTTRAGHTWTLLVEVKTGAGELERPQVETYLDIARDNGFKAVLTISNQLAPAPGVHPVEVDRRKLKKVALHHLSWAEVLTIAVQQRVHRGVSDPDQAWILGELIRYLEYRGSGALDFSDMGTNWVGVREAMAAGTLRANDKGLADVLSRWEQLLRFAALRLGRELGADVQVVVSRREAAEPALRIADQAQSLVGTGRLSGSLRIPAAVAPLHIVADLRAGRVSVAVDVDAPKEGRPATRVNWLARQLKDAPEVLRIDAMAANSRTSTSALLRAVREDPGVLIDDPKRDLRTFRVIATSPLGTKRGAGRGGFIDSVLAALDGFYGSVVQQVRPWTARAPQLPKGGRTAAEEAGLDLTPPAEGVAEALESVDENVAGVPPEAPTPEPVPEGVSAVPDPSPVLPPPDDDVATPVGSTAIDDDLATEELVSWSDAEDRLEHERNLEQTPEPSLAPDSQGGDRERIPATFDAEPDTLEEEKPEEWSVDGLDNAPDGSDDGPPE